MSSLAGKKAFVTGASRGIGAAIARRLAAEGADVAIGYERSAQAAETLAAELRQTGRHAAIVRMSAADPASGRQAVDQAASGLGGLDILVNNAGIFRGGPIEGLTVQEVDEVLAVNVRAVVLASHAALAYLPEGGRIVSIGSNLATRVPEAGVSLYALSKSALIGWTQGLARDLGPRGITVNLVHPGSTDTDMNPADGPQAAQQAQRMAIKRYGKAEDVAALVAFVAGPQAGSINGAGLTVDGGANA
ncbi:short-chain dehydrogenase [Bordetella ansorpii]|uniref:Short-chain dehydrogenase n=1 Tax=Bordetella ansorpii TaxID=288768 RepID=A0A157SKI5_9BORD|nr:SDR family NAD(P)-dependent oxidoreductase [Bordetella ansorpii]SAI70932.1 short-chain dehydrogenase [Bordetella ansorpii]